MIYGGGESTVYGELASRMMQSAQDEPSHFRGLSRYRNGCPTAVESATGMLC